MTNNNTIQLGWREWVALPELGLHAIKAKVDTGAKTSALHAFSTEFYRSESIDMVKFLIHPIQRNLKFFIECHAPIIDQRLVTDSGGHREKRFVISSIVTIGTHSRSIELTLTNRDTMRFRMLLGRRAMDNGVSVSPGASYINGKLKPRLIYGLATEKT